MSIETGIVALFKWVGRSKAARNKDLATPKSDCGPIQVGTARAAARTAGSEHVGRRSAGRRTAHQGSTADRSSPPAPRPRCLLPGSRHVSSAPRPSVPAQRTAVLRHHGSDGRIVERAISDRSILRATRSRPSHRRGRRQAIALAWNRRPPNSRGESTESHAATPGRRLERQVPHAAVAHANRNARGARLRPAELEEAHPWCVRYRRSLVGLLVRRLEEGGPGPDSAQPRQAGAHLARLERLARTRRRSTRRRREARGRLATRAGFGGERRGLNPQHPEPQSGALPIELRPPYSVFLSRARQDSNLRHPA